MIFFIGSVLVARGLVFYEVTEDSGILSMKCEIEPLSGMEHLAVTLTNTTIRPC